MEMSGCGTFLMIRQKLYQAMVRVLHVAPFFRMVVINDSFFTFINKI